jgi:hypothetical protein
MDIKIAVATHKAYWMPGSDIYIPLHVGKEGKSSIGYRGDDVGDTISLKNPTYCELTGLYWIWKNLQADYTGIVHYRRYFTRQEVRSIPRKKQQILTQAEWEKILLYHPIVVPDKRKYYIETNRSHYDHAHHPEGLVVTEQILKKKYPVYELAFTTVMNRTWAHMFNMFVMRRDYFDDYCSWLFDILFTLENRLDIATWNSSESRVFGYVGEILLDVWLEYHQYAYVEQNVSFMEKQNWLIKGGKFLERKFRRI